jgi:SAM-dependent methyltransferase
MSNKLYWVLSIGVFLFFHECLAARINVAESKLLALSIEDADLWQTEANHSDSPSSIYQFIRNTKRQYPKQNFLEQATSICQKNGLHYAFQYGLMYLKREDSSNKFDVYFDWIDCDRHSSCDYSTEAEFKPLSEKEIKNCKELGPQLLQAIDNDNKRTNSVHFELSLLRLKELKKSGKTIKLILGRTNTSTIVEGTHQGHQYPPLKQTNNEVWVFGDVLPGLNGPKDPIQLTMNFDHLDNLKKIENDSLDQIVVDAGVWHHMENTESNMRQYARILKTGGQLFVERYPYIVGIDEHAPKGTYKFNSQIAPRVLFISAQDAMTNFRAAQKAGAEKIAEVYRSHIRDLGFSDLKVYNEHYPYPIDNRLMHQNPYFGYYEFIK